MAKSIQIDLSGDKLLPHQRKLIRSKCRKTALICGRGAGKSYACAALILLTLLQGKNVLVGGQRYETIQTTLYEEIKNLAQQWGLYDLIIWRMSPMMMILGDAHVWFGTYESIDAVRGYSKVSLIVLDEMFLAPVNILSVWGPCMRATGGATRIVGATTPRGGSLWNVMFSDPKNDWEVITAVTTDNNKISQEEYELILSGITSDEMYRQEILGEISTHNNAAIIRLEDFVNNPAPTSDTRVIAGLDCGEGVERDASAFVKRQGNVILESWKLNSISHEETVRRIRESNRQLKIDKLNIDAAFSDYEYNILKYEIPCEQVNFARAATEQNKDKYANVRAEMYFNLAWYIRHGLYTGGLGDLESEAKRQLCAISWMRNSQGRLLLTKKEELREALKMSTDIADALALTCLDKYLGDDPVIQQHNQRDMAQIRRWATSLMG